MTLAIAPSSAETMSLRTANDLASECSYSELRAYPEEQREFKEWKRTRNLQSQAKDRRRTDKSKAIRDFWKARTLAGRGVRRDKPAWSSE